MLLIRAFFQSMLCVLLCVCATNAGAQQFGGNPPSLKWNQINTDTARVIFPVGLEAQAADVARIIHRLARTTQYSIGTTVRKINIVMQNQTTQSNGYVALGPYRSEFFLTPATNSFELGSLPWHKTLALHEYRHVQQNNNFRKGLTKAFYDIFGEEGQALASNLAIPDWFWEGDAVFQETLLSRQGRGRIPFFFNDYRSLWAAGKNYSWMKLRNGSYRDFTPDHYRVGYMLVAYGRERYGDSLWARVTDRAARFKGLFYPFQHAITATTGKTFPDFRNDALEYFHQQQIISENDSAALFAKNKRHFDADEEYPQWAGDDSIIYVRSSYKKIPAFYLWQPSTGIRKKIGAKDISNDTYFSYRNGWIVYAAYRTDPRWTWKNFGVISLMNMKTGRQKKITTHTKYFSPDISGDGKTVVAVEMNTAEAVQLHFLNAGSGKVIGVMPNPHRYIFTYPKFYGRNKVVSAVRNREGEMALGIFTIAGGDPEWLTPFSMNTIGFPQVTGDTITFTMSEGSQEKLFAAAGGKLYKFLPAENNTSTGSYQLTIRNGSAVYNAFTASGYHLFLAKAAFGNSIVIGSHSEDTVYDLKSLQRSINLPADTSVVSYPVTSYKQSFRLINGHSWRPYISDPEYSYSIVSENILNTLQAELYVTYNRNEKYKEAGATVSYAGWFPVISGGASWIFDREARNNANRLVTWNELNANLGLSVPLNFVQGSFRQQLTFSSSFNTQQVYYSGASKTEYEDKRFNYGEVSLYAVNQQITARQQIYPRFAQTFYARYRTILNHYTANQLFLNGALYLPGLFTNHSIVLQAAYQQRDTMQQYSFTNGFPMARGYSDLNFPRMWKLGANYHFPIAYPDWGFGSVVFFQRIRANVYFDYAQTKSLRTQTISAYKTAGAELYVDSKWWNQLPISLGLRYSRLLDQDPAGRSSNQWELVLPLNLLGR